MKFRKIITTTALLVVLLWGTFTTVEAVPPLPSSFHGTVKVNGANVPAGTIISAWIDDVQYAQTTSLMYGGDSVYALDVPGDDPSSTGVIEGGVQGDTITFKIGGVEAGQTGSWATGTNVERNLSIQIITVTADTKTKVYGASDPVLTYSYEPSTPPVTFEGGLSRDPGEDVGAYEITIGDLSATGYTINFVSANLTITKKPVTISADAKSKVYGSADPQLTFQVAPPLVTGDNVTGALARVTGDQVGSYPILSGTLAIDDGNGGANYTITFVSANLTITKRPITIEADDKEKIIGNSDPALTYAITAGSLAYDDQIIGSLIRDAGETVGTYPIRQGTLAISDGNSGGNYNLTFVNGSLTISQIPLTITAQSASKVYGAADPIFTYISSDPSVPLTGALGRETGETVGVYAMNIGTLSAGSQYAITFVPANFTITKKTASVTPNASTKVYGSADPAFSGTLTGFLAADSVTAVYSREAGETVASSPYLITAVLSPSGVLSNYDITYNTANFTITKKDASVTPNAQSKTYGDPDPTLTGVLNGFLAGDSVLATYHRQTGETVAGSPYLITAILSPSVVLENYNITYNTGQFTITKKDASVTPNAASKIYGDLDPTLTGVFTGFLAGDGVTAIYSRAAGETVAGSPYLISATLSPADALANYDVTYNTANFTITPKQITVTADAKSKTYGLPDPTLTYVVTGLQPGDSLSGILARLPGENVGTYQIISGSLTAGPNYSINFVPANLTINKRAITISADDKEKIVGEPDPVLTYSVTSGTLAYADVITGSLLRDAGEAIGIYPIRQGTLVINDGNSGENYNLTFVEGTFTIGQMLLTITADPASKVYGEVDPVFTYTASDPTVPLTGALGRLTGENVGAYAMTIGTLSAGDQYAITFVSANLTITKKTASVTPNAASKTYGDTDPALTGTLTGFLVSDGVTAVYSRAAGETVSGSPYLISAVLSPSGVLGNYDITYNTANFAITKKDASVTPNAASKIYGDADPIFTGTLTGFLAGDGVTAVYSRTAGESVAGSPYTISAVLSPAGVLGNYDITYNTADFTITKKAASVTPDGATKVYGDDDPVLTGTLVGFLPVDNVSAVYSRAAGETVAGSPYLISATLAPVEVLANYAVTYNTANFTITPKQITVTANAIAKVYGQLDPSLTYIVEGLEPGDTVSGMLARIPGENVGVYTITIGTITAGSNYTINFVPNSLTITPRAITVTADDKEKTVGALDPELTYTISSGSLVYEDEIVGDLVRETGEEIGTYAILQGSLGIQDGNSGANYNLTYMQGTFTISPISLTITANAGTKVYGEADPVLTYTVSDPSVPLTGELDREPGEDAGVYAITIGTLSAGDQYAITFIPANFTITPRPITITADDKEKVEGESDPALTYSTTSGSLVFTDTIVGALVREVGEDVGSYAILIGSLAIEDGNSGANYILTFVPGTFTITSATSYIYLPLIVR